VRLEPLAQGAELGAAQELVARVALAAALVGWVRVVALPPARRRRFPLKWPFRALPLRN